MWACRQGYSWQWGNLATVTGHTSGIFTVDVDDEIAWKYLKMFGISPGIETWKWSTGRGVQMAFKIPEGMEIPIKIKPLPGVDIKGEKGYAVVPPSIHHSGKPYSYINSPFDSPLADPPETLVTFIELVSGKGASPEKYEDLPEEIIELIKQKATKRKKTGTKSVPSVSGESKVEKDPSVVEILEGQRNNVLFRDKACTYRYLGYEEAEMFARLRVDNNVYCDPPLEEDEVREICQKVCAAYDKGDPADSEVLEAISGVDNYYSQNRPKGMAKHTDYDVVKALLDEALLHSSVVDEGVEVSISQRQLAEKAEVTPTTVRAAIKRLGIEGIIKKSEKHRKKHESGALILRKSFYSIYAGLTHPTKKKEEVEDMYVDSLHLSSNGMGGLDPHKYDPRHVRNRWGGGKFGKAKKHLSDLIEALDEFSEDEVFSPKELVEKINVPIADPCKWIKSTSISGHLATLSSEGVGILEKLGHGKYRRNGERYENLGSLMRATGEFKAAHDQRRRVEREREAYRMQLAEANTSSKGTERKADDQKKTPTVSDLDSVRKKTPIPPETPARVNFPKEETWKRTKVSTFEEAFDRVEEA